MTPETLEALVCIKDWLIKIPNNEGPSGTAKWRKGLMLTNWYQQAGVEETIQKGRWMSSNYVKCIL